MRPLSCGGTEMPEGGFARPFAGLWHGSRATAKRPEDVVASRRGLIPTDDVKSLQIPLFFSILLFFYRCSAFVYRVGSLRRTMLGTGDKLRIWTTTSYKEFWFFLTPKIGLVPLKSENSG